MNSRKSLRLFNFLAVVGIFIVTSPLGWLNLILLILLIVICEEINYRLGRMDR